jgi:hypothetical protein
MVYDFSGSKETSTTSLFSLPQEVDNKINITAAKSAAVMFLLFDNNFKKV